jgi:D-arabinose 1-dehydrogenase-like Zn-dependent alcohol dehydrogenase
MTGQRCGRVGTDPRRAWPGQVLVKVGGAGACHSDLHPMDIPAGELSFTLPFTLGHENAGWVERMGPRAIGFTPADPVIVYGPWGCGLCMNCRQGMENNCRAPGGPSPGGLGGNDGGMAEYLLVPSTRYLIPLGNLDPRDVAPLTDAGLTSYKAVKRSVHLLGPGSTRWSSEPAGWARRPSRCCARCARRQPLSRWTLQPTNSRPPREWAPGRH